MPQQGHLPVLWKSSQNAVKTVKCRRGTTDQHTAAFRRCAPKNVDLAVSIPSFLSDSSVCARCLGVRPHTHTPGAFHTRPLLYRSAESGEEEVRVCLPGETECRELCWLLTFCGLHGPENPFLSDPGRTSSMATASHRTASYSSSCLLLHTLVLSAHCTQPSVPSRGYHRFLHILWEAAESIRDGQFWRQRSKPTEVRRQLALAL